MLYLCYVYDAEGRPNIYVKFNKSELVNFIEEALKRNKSPEEIVDLLEKYIVHKARVK